jgi:hypothetical protein
MLDVQPGVLAEEGEARLKGRDVAPLVQAA